MTLRHWFPFRHVDSSKIAPIDGKPSASGPLPAHVAERRAPVGAIEMFGKDFVSGWMVRRFADAFLVIDVGEGAAANHTHFTERHDIEAPDGAEVVGFICHFDRGLRDGDRVTVVTNAGEALDGSPVTYAPSLARGPSNGGSIHVECPSGTVFRSLITMRGWVRLDGACADLTFLVNGVEQDVEYQARLDVTDQFRTPLALGWSFTCDVAEAVDHGNSLALRVDLNGSSIYQATFDAQLTSLGDALILFMHIPKTAGISLAEAIKAEKKLDSFWLYGNNRRPVDRQVAQLSRSAFDDLDVVGGHFGFGLHEKIARPCLYVTVLREPVAFLKSYFLYRKYVQRWPPILDLDIYGALEGRIDHLLDNGMTRFFAAKWTDPVDDGDLARAIAVMERRFAFVGLVERMNETVERLSSLLRVPLAVRHDNPTPPSLEASAMDMEELARRAEPFTRYDRALYRHAVTLFWDGEGRRPPIPPLRFDGETSGQR